VTDFYNQFNIVRGE